MTASLLAKTARVKSKGNLTKMTRDCRVEISEVHHGCYRLFSLEIKLMATSAQNLLLKGFKAVAGQRWRFYERNKESSVFA